MNRLDAPHDLRCPVMSRGADPDMCSCEPAAAVAETWASIPSRRGYEASSAGRIRSVGRYVDYSDGRRRWYPGKVLRPGRDGGQGYQHVNIRGCSPMVHSLVLEAFVGPRPDGMECCHGDGNHQNNALSNLRWDTHAANQRDTVRYGGHRFSGRTQCSRGHELIDANVVRHYRAAKGSRQCLACERGNRYFRRWRDKKGVVLDLDELCDRYYTQIMNGVAA